MSYENASITAPQSNSAGVWDVNFSAVYHFSKTTGALSLFESTANANNGTANGSLAASLWVGGAVEFNNSDISIPLNNFPNSAAPSTLEGWFNVQSLPGASEFFSSYLVSYGYPALGQANGIYFQSANGSQPFQAGWDGYATGNSSGQPFLSSKAMFSFGT